MQIGAISVLIVGLGIVGILFLAGILGITPHNYQPCVVKQTDSVSYSTVYTLGWLQVKEPVWQEKCVYNMRRVPGQTYNVDGNSFTVPAQ